MSIHQAGMIFESPRVKSEPITKEAAEKYLGQYQRDDDKSIVEVIWKDGNLAIRTPGRKERSGTLPKPRQEILEPPPTARFRHHLR